MGADNWHATNHDLLIEGDGTITNGNMGGYAFDVATATAMSSILQSATNTLVVVIRNRTSKPDVCGFSFRMDYTSEGSNINKASSIDETANGAFHSQRLR